MFTNLKEQVYEVKLPTHRQGHKQGEQRLSMLPLQKWHCPHGRQANLNKEVREGTICFMCYFANFPNNNTSNVGNFIKNSPQLTLTTEMTIMEEKLTSQVAMDTDVAE